MSKGWESKSVEEQQAAAALPKPANPDLDPEERARVAEQKRRIQALEMSRERVLSERPPALTVAAHWNWRSPRSNVNSNSSAGRSRSELKAAIHLNAAIQLKSLSS